MLVLGLAYVGLPFMPVGFLPSTDLPQHLAQIRMLEEMWGLASPTMDLSGLEVRLFGANTLMYVPLFLLSRIFPILLAGKLTIMLFMLGSVLGLHALARDRGRDPVHALLAGVFLFGPTFYWGFLNFLSGVPFFIWLVRYALRAPEAGLWKDAARFSLLLGGLYLAHVFWLVAGGLTLLLGACAVRGGRDAIIARALSVLPAGALALHWYPTITTARVQSGYEVSAQYLLGPAERLTPQWWVTSLFGGIEGYLEPAAAVALLVYVTAACWGARKSTAAGADRGLLLIALPFCLFALFAPDLYMNTILFGRRFLGVGAMLALLALPTIHTRVTTWAAVVCAGFFALFTTLAWVVYEQVELDGLQEALALVDEPKSVLGLSQRDTSMILRGFPFLQIFAYFQAQHGGELSFSFAEHVSSIVAYREPRKITWQGGLEWQPERATKADVAAFDCTLVNGNEEQHRAFVRDFGMLSPQTSGYFRLYCHTFGVDGLSTTRLR